MMTLPYEEGETTKYYQRGESHVCVLSWDDNWFSHCDHGTSNEKSDENSIGGFSFWIHKKNYHTYNQIIPVFTRPHRHSEPFDALSSSLCPAALMPLACNFFGFSTLRALVRSLYRPVALPSKPEDVESSVMLTHTYQFFQSFLNLTATESKLGKA